MTDLQLSSLTAAVRDAGNPEEGVQQWIAEHRELVESWLAW